MCGAPPRRFKRLITEAPHPPTQASAPTGAVPEQDDGAPIEIDAGSEAGADDSPWPDLVVIDGGRGQLTAAQETLAALGITDVPLAGVAKGPDRDAGLETFFMAGRESFKLNPRDPVLYFVQQLRYEAHRFAICSSRGKWWRGTQDSWVPRRPRTGSFSQ